MLPTLAKLTGAEVPDDRTIDGVDISLLLKGKVNKKTGRKFFLSTHYNNKDFTIRVGDWKYRKGCTTDVPAKNGALEVQLFNLKNDPYERNNLASQYPEKVREMTALLNRKYNEIKR